ncbi:hypothetical protein DFH06DRAFT_1374605 [Mycena polygramma]|nr:hypothetical protein DFH06DRAFT_1374605 [Mycena polygramma]
MQSMSYGSGSQPGLPTISRISNEPLLKTRRSLNLRRPVGKSRSWRLQVSHQCQPPINDSCFHTTTTTTQPHCHSRYKMPSTNIPFVNTLLEALMRLVRHLFGRGRVEDAEEGMGAPMELKGVGKVPIVVQGDIPTFKPDLVGVPALAVSSGAAFAVAPTIPTIIVTPPDNKPKTARAREPSRRPLQRTTVTPTKRVHGRTPPCKRAQAEKENVADHPNAPRRPQVQAARCSFYGVQATTGNAPAARCPVAIPAPSVEIDPKATAATAQPGSLAWERAKVAQLEEARAWSDTVKARHHRRSLPAAAVSPWVPAPPVRRASVSSTPPLASCAPLPVASPSPSVRLPLAERLKRAVVVCTPPTPEPVLAPVARLWSEDKGLFSLGFEEEEKKEERTSKVVPGTQDTADASLSSLSSSDSLGSLSSLGSMEDILDQFEDDLLHSPAWLGRRRFPEVEGLSGSERKMEDDAGRAHRDSTWSEVFSLDAYA